MVEAKARAASALDTAGRLSFHRDVAGKKKK